MRNVVRMNLLLCLTTKHKHFHFYTGAQIARLFTIAQYTEGEVQKRGPVGLLLPMLIIHNKGIS